MFRNLSTRRKTIVYAFGAMAGWLSVGIAYGAALPQGLGTTLLIVGILASCVFGILLVLVLFSK